MKLQSEERNLSMVMDFYEMTMSNGYFKHQDKNVKVAFDVFYRKNPDGAGFAIFSGLQQIVDYIINLRFSKEDISYLRKQNLFDEEFLEYLSFFKFTGDVYSFYEGDIMYPNEPVITVIAPLIEAQLVETAILLEFNHQSLIATKTNRIVRAADGRAVSDFGARRAHNIDAAVYGARAAYIGGAASTATVLAGQMFNIPISGTMAHSWVMFYPDEYTAFKEYALTYPNATTLLVDTYDVLKSGIPNAIRVANEVLEPMGQRLKGIRLDSGDLAYLSKEARKMLDAAGLADCKIVVSNSLDEYTIRSLLSQGACIDLFGVGERLITAKSDPVFGGVYKLCAVEKDGVFEPRIKISENIEKVTNPGLKKVWRIINKDGIGVGELLTLWDEDPNKISGSYEVIDTRTPWKKVSLDHCTFTPMQHLFINNGKKTELCDQIQDVHHLRNMVDYRLKNEVWEEEKRFENPHLHYLDMSPALYKLKEDLLNTHSL
ncbi:nicotinate phosphoribosyltransferase [Lacrimispora amygdalina]|uniref:nicotinate phosphoribosyltransferase n=1 Tax=Lacrimispora amygdalina TaxID=253257 RepID=UPI000BE387EB|nr:nicotinate phosphoribosyltransferase [Lacrimispora amygdalina]